MQDRQLCPLCQRAGLVSYLQSYQINLEEAVVLCENKLCTYPLAQNLSVATTFSRSLDRVLTNKANEEKVAVPDAQLALQTKVASHMRKTGLKLQSDAIGIQTGSPQLKKKIHRLPYKKNGKTPALLKQTGSNCYPYSLQLQNGSQSFQSYKSFTENSHFIPGAIDGRSWTNCNGSEGSSDKDSLLNSSGESLESASSSSSNSSLGDSFNISKASASFPAFQFGENKIRKLPKSLPNYPSLSSQDLQLNVQFCKDKNDVSVAIEKDTPKLENTKMDKVSKVDEVSLCRIPELSVINQCGGDCKLPGQNVNCKPVNLDTPENQNKILDKFQNCSLKMKGNEDSSVVERRDILLRYPSVFPQWRNKDALCWLDVILCLAVHNETLKSLVLSSSFERDNMIYRLFKAHNQACLLVQESEKNGAVPSSNIREKESSPSSAIDKQPDQSSVENRENSTPSETDNRGSCLDQNDSVENLLNEVREEVWSVLKSRLNCRKGQNESPVFAFPILLKENTAVYEQFKMTYRFDYECTECGYVEKTDHSNPLPTFPAVVPDFNIGDPQHSKKCPQCGNTSDTRTMVYKKLPECLLMHFTEGLPETSWGELQFGFHGDLYTVTGVVQYVNNPDHFIAWLRNPEEDRWFKCDDLGPTVCRHRSKEPKFSCRQMHIIMWERLKLKARLCRQLAVDTDPEQSLEKQKLGKISDQVCSYENKQQANVNNERSKRFGSSENLNSYSAKLGSKVNSINSHSIRVLDTSPCSTRSSESSDFLLPDFIASTPVSESVLRPIPKPVVSVLPIKTDRNDACTGKDLVEVNSAQTVMSKSKNLKTDDWKHDQKLKNPGVTENPETIAECRITADVTNDQIQVEGKECQSNLPCSQISGKKTLIKPSTVFCVPKKSVEENLSLNSGLKVNSNSVVKSKTHNDHNVTYTSEVKETKCNSSVTENKSKDEQLNGKENLKGTSGKTGGEEGVLLNQRYINLDKACKKEIKKNFDIIKESGGTQKKGLTSSSRLSHSSRFKVPFSSNKKPNISKDAFFTLETENKSTAGSSGASTPSSMSLASSPALSGNLTYFNSVKQYLLSRTTGRTDQKFKFEGLNLKSVSGRSNSFNLSELDIPASNGTTSIGSEFQVVSNSSVDSLDETRSISNSSTHSSVLSRSALVNKLIEKLEQSPLGGNRNRTTLKRKLENEASKNPKKRAQGSVNQWDAQSSGNTSLKENSKVNNRKRVPGGKSMKLVRNLVNAAEKAKTEQETKTKCEVGSTDFGDKIVDANETKCESESVLQDLYEALNIPFSSVNATMSDIMTDVDDILNFVNVGDVVPDQHQCDRPLSFIDSSATGNQKYSS